jgi:hypothetical protein
MTRRHRRSAARVRGAAKRRRRRDAAVKTLERVLAPSDVFVFSEVVAQRPAVARVLS